MIRVVKFYHIKLVHFHVHMKDDIHRKTPLKYITNKIILIQTKKIKLYDKGKDYGKVL